MKEIVTKHLISWTAVLHASQVLIVIPIYQLQSHM